jgi:hypothetical protein
LAYQVKWKIIQKFPKLEMSQLKSLKLDHKIDKIEFEFEFEKLNNSNELEGRNEEQKNHLLEI